MRSPARSRSPAHLPTAGLAPAPPPPPYSSGGYAAPPAQPAPAYLPQPGMYSAPPAAPAPAPPVAYPPVAGQPYPAGMYQPQPRRGISTGCLVVAAIVLTLAAVAICAALAWFVRRQLAVRPARRAGHQRRRAANRACIADHGCP